MPIIQCPLYNSAQLIARADRVRAALASSTLLTLIVPPTTTARWGKKGKGLIEDTLVSRTADYPGGERRVARLKITRARVCPGLKCSSSICRCAATIVILFDISSLTRFICYFNISLHFARHAPSRRGAFKGPGRPEYKSEIGERMIIALTLRRALHRGYDITSLPSVL